MSSELKPNWWCIGHECKHNRIHFTCKGGRPIEHVGCANPDVLDLIDYINPNLGLELRNMRMCPVLVTDSESCIDPGYFDKAL